MKPELVAKLLLAASMQIEEAVAELDRTTTRCEHCTAQHWANRDEYHMAIELEAASAKLQRFAKKISSTK